MKIHFLTMPVSAYQTELRFHEATAQQDITNRYIIQLRLHSSKLKVTSLREIIN